MPAGEDADSLDELVEKFGAGQFTLLSFPKTYENRFEQGTASFRARRMWREGLATILLSLACLLIDLATLHDPHWSRTVRETLLTIPLALIANEVVRRDPPMWIRESVVAATIIFIGGLNLLFQASEGTAGVCYGVMATLICALFVSTVMRLRFSYQITTVSCLAAGVYSLLLTTPYMSPAVRVMSMSVFTLAIGLVLLSAYSLEREERMGFLLRLRGEMRQQAIVDSNVFLLEAVQSDSLTGLGNRRKLEDRLSLLWRSESQQETWVSAVILDVDHFKMVNDRFGHSYGDQVLVRIASLIRNSLHKMEDLAVRWGGEEFVVLLPHTELAGAIVVAERIRILVETAGSPPPLSSKGQAGEYVATTVSCGVCSCRSSATLTPDMLISLADTALYQAKKAGRNRVVAHHMHPHELEAHCSLSEEESALVQQVDRGLLEG